MKTKTKRSNRKSSKKVLTSKKPKTMKTKSSLREKKLNQPLDSTELKIVKMLDKGLSRPEIGKKMNLIQSTLWTKLKVIRYKLNVKENIDSKILSSSRKRRLI